MEAYYDSLIPEDPTATGVIPPHALIVPLFSIPIFVVGPIPGIIVATVGAAVRK